MVEGCIDFLYPFKSAVSTPTHLPFGSPCLITVSSHASLCFFVVLCTSLAATWSDRRLGKSFCSGSERRACSVSSVLCSLSVCLCYFARNISLQWIFAPFSSLGRIQNHPLSAGASSRCEISKATSIPLPLLHLRCLTWKMDPKDS